MLQKFIVVALLSVWSLQTGAKELAITFDDSPRFAHGYFNGKQRSQKLIEQLSEHGVSQVAFFSIANALDEEGRARLDRYTCAIFLVIKYELSQRTLN